MDQTTDTADLSLETEKYLNCVDENSESDSDIDDEVANDALLGGIRSGLSAITRSARQALSTCKNKTELDGAIGNIEASTLKLLRLEKSFLKTATIVSEVIDDMVSDFEDDSEVAYKASLTRNDGENETSSIDKEGSGDASINAATLETPEPYIFGISEKNLESIVNFKEKLTGEFHARFDRYKNGLSETELKADEKFLSLMKQIKLGKTAAEKAIMDAETGTGSHDDDDDDRADSDGSFLSSLPFSAEELAAHRYKPYNEDEELDDSVLPTVDPVTKELIAFPVRNKYCNHVFDQNSIYNYIGKNSSARCPVQTCMNERVLEKSHFISDPILTEHVRRKNFNV